MSNLNLTEEQIQEAISAMAGSDFNPPNPTEEAIEHIVAATANGRVRNVTKVQGGELRCIVTDDNGIKPTTIENGATHQDYNDETDAIAWLCVINNNRSILRQTKDAVEESDINGFRNMFGDKTGYALSYLSSFNSNNNILLDDEKVNKYEEARVYAEGLIGDLGDDLRTFITTMCTNTDNFERVCDTWDNAKVYGPGDKEETITWGCRARTEEDYVAFESTYVVLWTRPIIAGVSDDPAIAPDSLTQLVTRQVNADSLPNLAQDSKATFLIEEIVNDNVLGYAIITDDTLTGKLSSIRLFKTKAFDEARKSF